jgi:hypothetical protein
MNRMAAGLAALAASVYAGSLGAHHSLRMIEIPTPVWVKGAVVRYEIGNPHTMIELDETTADGQVVRWTIEGPIPGRVERMHVDENLLKRGDVVEVCGFRPKSQPLPGGFAPDIARRPYIHGHLIVMRDGRKQPWGPYGKLNNCVRPGDDAQSWVELLNADTIARDLWCQPLRTSVPTVAAAKSLADEIDPRLASPCR